MADVSQHPSTFTQHALKWTVFLATTGLVVYFCLLIVRPFLNVIAWSSVLVITFYPVQQRLVRKTGRVWLSGRLGFDGTEIVAWVRQNASELTRVVAGYTLAAAQNVAGAIVSFAFSLLGGLQVFGVLGIVLGPLLFAIAGAILDVLSDDTAALFRAGASLTPSPVMATMSPRWRRASTILSLCSGDTRAKTLTSPTAAAISGGGIRSSSAPVRMRSPAAMPSARVM